MLFVYFLVFLFHLKIIESFKWQTQKGCVLIEWKLFDISAFFEKEWVQQHREQAFSRERVVVSSISIFSNTGSFLKHFVCLTQDIPNDLRTVHGYGYRLSE